MGDDVQRDLGRHDARLDAMEQDLQQVRDQLRDVCTTLRHIEETLSTAAGGWKTMLLIGGLIASIFHVAGWLLDKVPVSFK